MPKVTRKDHPKPCGAARRTYRALSLRGCSTLARPKPRVNCSICNDQICLNTCDVISLPCGHSFGEICADAWILVNERCPSCFSKVNHGSIFPETSRYEMHLAQVYIKAVNNAHAKLGLSGVVAGTLVAGGELVSSCVEKLALTASSFCSSAYSKDIQLRGRIDPRDQINARKLIKLKNMVRRVKIGAGATARISGCLSNAVGAVLGGMGNALVPALSQGSKAILAELAVDEDTASRLVDGTLEVAKGAFLCTGQIIRGLENAGAILVSSVATTMVREFEYCCGIADGELAEDAGTIARDLTTTMWNTAALSPTSLRRISRTVAQRPYQQIGLNQIESTERDQNPTS